MSPTPLEIAQEVGRHAGRTQPRRAARKLAYLDAKGARATDRELAERQGLAEGLTSVQRCLDCGMPLTDPVSRARRIGPDCFAKRREAGLAP